MYKLTKTIFVPFIFLAMLLFASPIHLVSAGPTISMVDVRTFNPDTFRFPGGGAFSFRPGIVTVSQGGMVTFTDNGYDEHTVTSYTSKMLVDFEGVMVNVPIPDHTFDSGINSTIKSGQSWSLNTTGLAPGDYKYFCQIHPWMQAVLRVVAGSSSMTATVRIDHHQGDTSQFFSGSASWGFLPRNLRVSQGTTVTVVNSGHIFHTFSSYTMIIPVQEGFKTLMIPISNGVFNQTIAPGQSYTLNTTNLSKGTYTYACLFHPWMLGTLIVT